MTEYRYNPAWMATTAIRSTAGDHTPGDLGVLMHVLGEIGSRLVTDAEIEFIHHVVANPDERGLGVEVAHVTARDVGGFFTLGHAIKGAGRMANLVNGGAPMFREVHVGKHLTTYVLAGGPASMKALPMFGKEMAPVAGKRPGRHHVILDPALVGRMKSTLTLPTLGRALAWMRAGATQGLPDPAMYRHDRDERTFTFTLAPSEVGDVFGFALARTRPAYVLPALDRIVADLKRVGISMRVTPRKAGTNIMLGITLREYREVDVDMDPGEPHDVRYDGLPVQHFKRPVKAADTEPTLSEVFTLMDDDAPDAVDAEAVEPVAPAETIEAPEDASQAPVKRRGRMKGIAVVDEPDVAEPDVPQALPVDNGENAIASRPAEPLPPPPIDRSVVHDLRPMWLKRRFVYTHDTMPSMWADRPIGTHEELKDALRAGVHVWAFGMDARPVTYQGLTYEHGCALLMNDWSMARERSYWCTHMMDRPHVAWTEEEGGYVPRRKDDDPEGDLLASSRSKPRDMKGISGRPHDGLGYVDEAGNPVDDEGNPVDRSSKERAWDHLVPRVTIIA